MERHPLTGSNPLLAAPTSRVVHSDRSVDGISVPYSLYLPAEPPASSAPLPLVVLTHGFMGSERHWAWLAPRLASQAGVVVFTHDMTSLLARPHEDAQRRNILGLADHVEWLLVGGGGAPALDASRVVLCGHSAGGAVAFEAAVELSERRERSQGGASIAVVLLLDAVPWPRTLEATSARFPPATLLISLRSEPSAWNMHGEVLKLLRQPSILSGAQCMPQRVMDFLLVGSRHADPVRPRSGGMCVMSCLGLLGPAACAELYAELALAVSASVRTAPAGISSIGELVAFSAAVDAYSAKGALVKTAL